MVVASVIALLVIQAFFVSVASDKVIALDEDTFDTEVLKGDLDTKWMLKFYAPWCGRIF